MLLNDKMLIRIPKNVCPIHTNPELEVIYVRKGTLQISGFMDKIQEIPANCFTVILPYQLHGFPVANPNVIVLMFPYMLYKDNIETDGILVESGIVELNPKVAGYIDYLIDKYCLNPQKITEKSLFYAFMQLSSGNAEKIRMNNEFIPEIFKYIYEHISEEILLSDLADHVGYTARKLSSEFKKLFGIKLIDFIGNIRIERACALLQSSNISITEISEQCGFGSLRNFNRIFLMRIGVSPSKYRNDIVVKSYSQNNCSI